MAKTLHFFMRSFSPYLLIYLAFGCLAVGGSWLSGTPNGLFGSYASMMPMIGVMPEPPARARTFFSSRMGS